jgi:hypothetical protein
MTECAGRQAIVCLGKASAEGRALWGGTTRTTIGRIRKIAEKRSEVLTLTARLRQRDKRGSPVESQTIDMAWVPECRSLWARAAHCVFSNAVNSIFGTVDAFARLETRL